MTSRPTEFKKSDLHNHYCGIKCLSWTAVIAGGFVAIGLGFLLNIFSMALGLTALKATNEGLIMVAIGGYAGLLIGTIASMFVAGWVAGFLGRATCYNRHIGFLYGFITWCFALILAITLASSIGQFVSFQYHSLSNPHLVISKVRMNESNTSSEIMATSNSTATSHENTVTLTKEEQEKIAKSMGISLFLTFILFFIGALSSCLGGYVGLKPKDYTVE